MAHEIDMANGRANMAYVGKLPWHGLGAELKAGASIEQWTKVAGLGWELREAPVLFKRHGEEVPVAAGIQRKVLYRADTGAGLSVVSDTYKPVQPKEIMEFFRDLVGAAGFELHTAGSLRGGRKVWSLAKIGEQAQIAQGDKVEGYLLLATACDGTLATTARFTSVRVVCANTLHMATSGKANKGHEVKVPHFVEFDEAKVKEVKAELGIAHNVWSSFIEAAKLIAKVKLDDAKAVHMLQKVFAGTDEQRVMDSQKFMERATAARRCLELYQGQGLGSQLVSAQGTAWGLVNAVTQFYDHESKAWGNDFRLDSAWFGRGAAFKDKAWAAAVELAVA